VVSNQRFIFISKLFSHKICSTVKSNLQISQVGTSHSGDVRVAGMSKNYLGYQRQHWQHTQLKTQ